MIFFGEASLQRAQAQFGSHYHGERPHQGKGNKVLFFSTKKVEASGSIQCHERLEGMLKYYHREAG